VVRDAFGNEAPTTRDPTHGPAAPKGRGAKRAATRQPLRSGQVLSRDGEVLTRQRLSGGGHVNEFDIPEHARDPIYDLQWVRTSCHGKPDQANVNHHMDNGWRPAAPKFYPQVMPDQRNANVIERDGLMLMERPKVLTEQALAEQHQDALELRNIQTEAFGNRKLPKGFREGYKSKYGDGRKKVERGEFYRAPAETRPQYEYAGPDSDD
jgi:hypothetical protein